MSAFLDFLNAYAIFFYIAGAVFILFGIKLLADSRRIARTTLFTLEQEQANDQAFRAILIMLAAVLFIAAVTAINTFVTPVRPVPEGLAAEATTLPYTPPVVLPTITPVPTLTSAPPTAAPTVPATRAASPVPAKSTAVKRTPEPTPVTPTEPPPSPVPAKSYPAPALLHPGNGESISAARIQFSWELETQLASGDFYRVTVSYTDRQTNSPVVMVKCTERSGVDTRIEWRTLGDAQGAAANGRFTWSVVIVGTGGGGASACDAGQGALLSPPSETRTFTWN
ncbi:MAG: hypothetical protein ACM3JD_15355 [Rudaea sp.]